MVKAKGKSTIKMSARMDFKIMNWRMKKLSLLCALQTS